MTPKEAQVIKTKEDRIEEVYTEFDFMTQNVMGKNYPEFNDRNLKQFIDDSQKRANGYTPSREAQGKEDWEANVFTGTTRNKVRAYASSVSKEPPEIKLVAVNEKNEKSLERAEVLKTLVGHSYTYCQNPALTIFEDGWDCSIDGTIVKYDGYLLVKDKVEIIKSYDATTGEIEVETVDSVIEDRYIEEAIPLTQFLIRDPFESDVQKQPSIIWARYMELEDFLFEYGKYPNAKKVEVKSDLRGRNQDVTSFFGPKLNDRLDENKVEVLCYFRKRGKDGKSHYRIVANKVEIFDGPLLWGKKKKVYPFSKTVFEPFARRKFFWGNSLPNILMPHQDTENSLVNSMLDKTTRSLETPLLIDMVNKGQLELEDSLITGDSKIYVSNVDGVKPLPTKEITQSEIIMLKDVASRLSMASLDSLQEGYSQSGATAREIVIANERSTDIKSLFYLMLSDLWLQKVRIRIVNILMQYGRLGKKYRLETQLSQGNKGVKEVRVGTPDEISQAMKPIGYDESGNPYSELDVFEEMMSLKGEDVEVVIIPMDYLDEWEYDVEIMVNSVFQKSKSLDMALETEKQDATAKIFPEIFMANKGKFFEQLMRKYGDDPRRYTIPETPAALPGMSPGASVGGPLGSQLTAPTKSLPALAGT